jgi:CheY-like chemotaxis protein
MPGKVPTFRCSICGTLSKEDQSGKADDRSISLDEVSFVDESISIPGMDHILVVGYTPSVRDILVDKMTEQRLARSILPLENGEDMIVKVILSLTGQNGGNKIDLVVTDVPMPFLNGINASIGLRAVERTYLDHDLIPILFLTNKPCDETFKKVIRFLAPAKYATLGPVDDRDKLIRHLTRMLALVGREKW